VGGEGLELAVQVDPIVDRVDEAVQSPALVLVAHARGDAEPVLARRERGQHDARGADRLAAERSTVELDPLDHAGGQVDERRHGAQDLEGELGVGAEGLVVAEVEVHTGQHVRNGLGACTRLVVREVLPDVRVGHVPSGDGLVGRLLGHLRERVAFRPRGLEAARELLAASVRVAGAAHLVLGVVAHVAPVGRTRGDLESGDRLAPWHRSSPDRQTLKRKWMTSPSATT
jgi:hypothetical protein